MKRFRSNLRPVSVVLTICMLCLSVPYTPCAAALIGTETILDATDAKHARQNIKEILTREDVKQTLENQGISLKEATARVDALTAREVMALEKRLEELPAGGDALGTVVFAALFVFVVLLITDILGHTDVFPFVTKTASE